MYKRNKANLARWVKANRTAVLGYAVTENYDGLTPKDFLVKQSRSAKAKFLTARFPGRLFDVPRSLTVRVRTSCNVKDASQIKSGVTAPKSFYLKPLGKGSKNPQ